ncbi:MAG: 16S rRNA (guanine(966)-N(2))-methyltransferase RsmD [Lachnospiraceae bacterium]|nr:16S rRNA (guanine(966)-N(2))-methyltransferase RsmD [Lachnospiraceae bacterium]
MRVIAGKARSLPLKTPAGENTRPTTDRIKETLFNMIQMEVPDCVFADFFSGSGGIGIEALSRGARKAYFIDQDKEAISCIESNIAFTKFTEEAVVIKQDVFSALNNIYEKHVDIIFMDPPYNMDLEKKLLGLLKHMKYVDEDTIIIIEASLETSFDDLDELGYEVRREKEYKTNKHVFVRLKKDQ